MENNNINTFSLKTNFHSSFPIYSKQLLCLWFLFAFLSPATCFVKAQQPIRQSTTTWKKQMWNWMQVFVPILVTRNRNYVISYENRCIYLKNCHAVCDLLCMIDFFIWIKNKRFSNGQTGQNPIHSVTNTFFFNAFHWMAFYIIFSVFISCVSFRKLSLIRFGHLLNNLN